MIGCAPAFNALRSRRPRNKARQPVIMLEMHTSGGRSTEHLRRKEELVFIITHESVQTLGQKAGPELV